VSELLQQVDIKEQFSDLDTRLLLIKTYAYLSIKKPPTSSGERPFILQVVFYLLALLTGLPSTDAGDRGFDVSRCGELRIAI
jgi:hypothetical protein